MGRSLWLFHIQCGSRFLPSNFPVIAHLITTTEPAIATEKARPKPSLPPEYIPYASVFLKEVTDHVSPFHLYDHEINHDDTFKPKIGKVYSLSPEEWKATEDFLDENLRTGKIHPSNSLQVSPFSFIKKKDGGLRPCQDYCYINKHTVHDAYPLPLISDLIDNLQGAKIFTKFDVWWGYNNICIKDGHQWKAIFITHKGLFKPTIMFFDLTNSSATFQCFMDDSFYDMIAEGWLVLCVVYKGDLILDYLIWAILTRRPMSAKYSISQEQRLSSKDVELLLNRRTQTGTRISRGDSIKDKRVRPDYTLVLRRSRVGLLVQENCIYRGRDVHGPTWQKRKNTKWRRNFIECYQTWHQ